MNEAQVAALRRQYPLLERRVEEGRPIVYLDNAATALKPRRVVQAVCRALERHAGNVHRSVHLLGDEATQLYEGARRTVAEFLGAEDHEIVFVRNTTEALNLVAAGLPIAGRVLTTLAEHHSNLLPWTSSVTRMSPSSDGSLDMVALERELKRGDVGLVSLAHVSNVTGAQIDVPDVAARVHAAGGLLLLDAAQSAPHQRLDVAELECDLLAFSGHKLGAPAGIGVLFGRAEVLARMGLLLHGGGTVEEVHADRIVYRQPPWRFEAGTPPVEIAAGLAAAIDGLEEIGLDGVEARQRAVTRYTLDAVQRRLPRARLIGPVDERRVGPVSFVVPGLSPHVLARGLSDGYGICVRSGFHCAQPLHEALGSAATLRVAPYVYNTFDEIDRCVDALAELAGLHQLRSGRG